LSGGLALLWRAGVTAAPAEDGRLVVQGPSGRLALGQMAPALVEALRRFDPPGEDEDRLTELVRSAGNGARAQWYYVVEGLSRRGLLCHGVQANRTRLAMLLPVSPAFVARPDRAVAGQRYLLSRFALFRRYGTDAVLESPLAHARVILNDCRAAALVGALAAPATAAELTARLGTLPEDAVNGLLTLLLRAEMLCEVHPDGTCAEDNDPALQTWEFHDLLFHARSRAGRSDASYGATYRLAGRLAPPPALKPSPAGEAIELYRPDLGRLKQEDPPLAWIRERRRSVREFDGERPLTDRQLGEFLFRVARVKECRQEEVATPHGPVVMEFASRPYPAGGSLHELEVYAVVNRCANLGQGLYYYDPARHRLIRLCGRTADVMNLLREAAQSTDTAEHNLQVLLILAARYGRVAWKYESLAYALTLKHVGVVLQTMYLAAAAMGLAPCAVGGGDADLFARAA
jgi:SagB-type dehydrogenase family enzyme